MHRRIRSTVTAALATFAFLGAMAAVGAAQHSIPQLLSGVPLAADDSAPGRIAPYRARFDRVRPVVAVIAENAGTELTDFVIPYGVLARSGVAETISVATRPGPVTMRPTLRIVPQATIGEFDARFAQGADYVIVPAVVKREDPALLAWITAQAAKGATIVSICDGALVVANTGLMDGRLATAHWATQGMRAKHYPAVRWVKNLRYVSDGPVVSSVGISAAIPVSIALVEAIAGGARAAALAAELGVSDWGTAHDTDAFRPRFGVNLLALARTTFSNGVLHRVRHVGLPIADGVDEIALALLADAYSRTGRSHAVALAETDAPVATRSGLVVLSDRVAGGADPVDRVLPPVVTTRSALVLDEALAGIAQAYGRSTAYGVALNFEYPGFRK
jgi:putative intracellular protease/amidase